MGLALALAGALLAAQPAAAAEGTRFPELGGCSDDRGINRCDPDQHRLMLQLYGAKPIEDLHKTGDLILRAFYVDGYGNDVASISFIRAKGDDPRLAVHFPKPDAGPADPPLGALVPKPVWDDIVMRSAHFDRPLARPPEDPDSDAIVLCLHGSVYIVEATVTPEGAGAPDVRRRTENSCDDGLAEAFANELAKAAVPLLAPCAVLDPSQHRGVAKLLSACRFLRGDRIAAAAVRNQLDPFLDGGRPEWSAAELAPAFAYKATVDWAGQTNGAEDAALFWARMASADGGAQYYWEEVIGESPESVRVEGLLVREIEGAAAGEPHYRQAKVELLWREESCDRFVVERASVGPMEPVPLP